MSAVHGEPYELLSVDRSTAPGGHEGDDWVRYTIAQGSNTITGYRRGNLAALKRELQAVVLALNERRSGKPGRTATGGRPSASARKAASEADGAEPVE
jgi:hypothetical protein